MCRVLLDSWTEVVALASSDVLFSLLLGWLLFIGAWRGELLYTLPSSLQKAQSLKGYRFSCFELRIHYKGCECTWAWWKWESQYLLFCVYRYSWVPSAWTGHTRPAEAEYVLKHGLDLDQWIISPVGCQDLGEGNCICSLTFESQESCGPRDDYRSSFSLFWYTHE